MGIMSMGITITEEHAEALIAFIRNHERSEIPDDVWDACQAMMDATDTDTPILFCFTAGEIDAVI